MKNKWQTTRFGIRTLNFLIRRLNWILSKLNEEMTLEESMDHIVQINDLTKSYANLLAVDPFFI